MRWSVNSNIIGSKLTLNYNNYNLNKVNKTILLFSVISQKAAPMIMIYARRVTHQVSLLFIWLCMKLLSGSQVRTTKHKYNTVVHWS